MATRKIKPTASAPSAFDSLSVEEICDRFLNGETYTSIARSLGVPRSSLHKWINLDRDRSARVFDARVSAASAWDEKAEEIIMEAGTPFDLNKARELAHHYRWRASKISPADYGEKKEAEKNSGDVTITGGLPE